MRRLKILLSAYCCEPDRGSEPGVGWNIALGLARHHDVWVLTRNSNRATIEAALGGQRPAGLHFVYFDLPRWLRWWKRGMRGLQLYYYLWQLGVIGKARALHRRVRFDVAHHLTLGRYWTPSFLWVLPVPFIWGPVGGGEDAPRSHYGGYGPTGVIYELLRDAARALAQLDPFVRLTARRSRAGLFATPDTERRIVRLGVNHTVRVHGQTGVSSEELEVVERAETEPGAPFRILTLGRLLHWKGVHLGLAAFAEADADGAEYWIAGEGPQERRLRRRVESLGISERVVFLGQVPRKRALELLHSCDVLLHPALHDFSPTVVLEAMAARKPVLCLDLGGPAVQVTDATGLRVSAPTPEAAVAGLARGLRLLRGDPELRRRMGNAGHERVASLFTWDRKVQLLCRLYADAASGGTEPARNRRARGKAPPRAARSASGVR